MSCVIRPCIPADWAAVERMTRDAFWDVYKPGCDEHYLVHVLHEQNAPAAELNLVAELNGEIIGQIICVPALLQCGERTLDDVLCLGPLTVAPAHQRQGVGTQLMQACVNRAATLGWRAIFLVGDPNYYHRFGYRATSEYGITLPNGETMDVLMTLPLYPGALEGCEGAYEEPAIYASITPDNVTVFDRQFPPREKHVLPTQIFHPEEM